MFCCPPHLRVWFAFVLGNNGLNAQKIPQTLCNGIFEIPLPLEDDWRVAVFPDRALIPSQYGHRGDARGTTAELVGRAIRLPAASAPEIIARHWIRKDPQKQLEEFLAGRVRPRLIKNWQIENPFFSTMHGFELKLPFDGPGPSRFGRIALLFLLEFADPNLIFW